MKKTNTFKIGDFNAKAIFNFEINKDSDFVITSYWWGRGNINRNSRENKTYDQLADRLIDDCIRNKCNYFIAEIPEFAVPGGYQKAINYKPEFLIQFIKNIIPSHITKAVYIDTDMSIHKFPSLFNMKGYDFMGYNWNFEPRTMYSTFPLSCYDPYILHTSGGLLMFANNNLALELLNDWNEMVKKNPGKAEDRMLSIPFNDKDMIVKLRCFWLPDEYFWLPYFYEYDDQFYAEKGYQSDFKKRGISFSKNYTDEMSMTKFFDFKKKDMVITHPEMLTSEEMAAKQGADLNRVPLEWFKSQGRKKRCLTDLKKLIINPYLFLQNKADFNGMKNVYKWLALSKFAKLEMKPLKLEEKKLKIYKQSLKNNSKNIIICLIDDESDLIKNRWISNVRENFIMLYRTKTDLPSIIYSVMKKYKRHVIFMDINTEVTEKFNGFNFLENEGYDFACLNANAHPYYKSTVGNKCKDPRFLNCVSSHLLFFRYNFFGMNVLRAWKYSSKTKSISDAQKLSKGFNKYGLILNTRCKWLDPGYLYNPKGLTIKSGYEKKILTNNTYNKLNKKQGLDDYLIQCGEKRRISFAEGPYSTHYYPSKVKKLRN